MSIGRRDGVRGGLFSTLSQRQLVVSSDMTVSKGVVLFQIGGSVIFFVE